jgi:hypothetical protein
MTRTCLSVIAVVGMAMSSAFAQQPPAKEKDTGYGKPAAAQPDKAGAQKGDKQMQPPPGMSEADMQAMMAAATPGPMHAHLQKSVGNWTGKVKMWMAEGAEPQLSDCTTTISSLMDGRFTKCETKGSMGEMPFQGIGIYGYDNVAQKFQSTWIDSMGTGMATGTGTLSPDGKTLTWTCSYNCPIKKGPITMREIERYTGPNTMVLEMYAPDPKTGKEFKTMEIACTRAAGGDGGMTKPMPTR